MMPLRYYQQEAGKAVFDYWASESGHPLVDMATGCHAAGTKILMYDGTAKPVELVAANDNLMGPDSKPRRVLRVVSGREMMYRITPTKGDAFVVNECHILSLKTTNEGKKAEQYPGCAVTAGRVENIKVSDYLGKAKYWKHLRKLWRTGIDFSAPANDNLPVPAYIVGAMLGDGTMVRSPCLTNMDHEVLDAVCDYAESLGTRSRITKKPNNQAWQVYFPDDESSKLTRNRFASVLENAGLWGMVCGEKRIPQPYKSGSRHTRLEVLAGLLDTDGHLSRSSHFDFISKSEGLSRDVAFVARSLGLAAYISECEKYCQTGGGGTYWRVSISGDTDIIPNRVERQKAKPRKQIKNPLVTGFSIEPVGVGDYYGFALDGDHLYLTEDFTVHHNTGKSITQATLTLDLVGGWPDMRVMSVTHVIELVESNFKELLGLNPFAPVGVFAAALNQRDHCAQILFAQLQTVWNKADLIGHIDVLIIDEVHLVPAKEDTMYRKLIDALLAINPDMKIVGYSATLYRLDSGRLDEGEDKLFDKVVYEYGIRRGIDDGYLCPITSKRTSTKYDLTGVGKSMGDYKLSDYVAAVDSETLNRKVVEEVLDVEGHRQKALFFCRGIEHATHMRDAVRAAGRTCEIVHGKTPAAERRRLIAALKAGEIWSLSNDNVLSTGTNIVGIDLIVDSYKTLSAGRYVQRVGRGTRVIYPPGFDPEAVDAAARCAAIAGGPKPNCRYMDFAGNIDAHGPVDMINPKRPGKGEGQAPIKICPTCEEQCHAAARVCSCCGFQFEFDETPKYTATASDAAIISTQDDWRAVTGRTFREHPPKPGKPPSIKCTYRTGLVAHNEWHCPGHPGYPKAKADRYWRLHGGALPFPKSADEWLDRAEELKVTAEIRLKPNGRYHDIIDWRAGESHGGEPAADNDNWKPMSAVGDDWEDEVPF